MVIAVLLGVVATAVALLALLGNTNDRSVRISQLFVYALPLGILAAGYAADTGINLMWAIVAAVSAMAAILVGGLLGRAPTMQDETARPGAAGLNLVCSGAISLGLGAIVLIWASHLISAFSYLRGDVVSIVLALAAVAFAVGGRSEVGLSRTVLVVAIIGAIALLGVGILAGDIAGLSAPQVPVPPLSVGEAIAYAVGVVIIGAGYPALRIVGPESRRNVIVAAVLVALVGFVTVLGILALYGGAFQLPSLVINALPVYSPPIVSGIISALVALVAIVVAGGAIHTAGHYVGLAHPGLLTPSDRVLSSPRLWIYMALGAVVVAVVLLAPTPSWLVFLLAALGVVNLLAEWKVSASRSISADEESANEPVTATN